jgi:hypothetical protein
MRILYCAHLIRDMMSMHETLTDTARRGLGPQSYWLLRIPSTDNCMWTQNGRSFTYAAPPTPSLANEDGYLTKLTA